jgi:hypothetical protein
MTRPSRLGIYADLQPVLDAALAAGGGSYTLATRGDAVHWRQRAYKFRIAYAREHGTPNRYDALLLRRIPPAGSPDDNVVTIEVRQATGLFTPSVTRAPQADALTADALAIAKRLLGE